MEHKRRGFEEHTGLCFGFGLSSSNMEKSEKYHKSSPYDFCNIFCKYFESDVTCGQVWLPILRVCALQLTHPKCTHTAVNTHTVNTHPEQWAAIYAAAPGEQLWVRCLGSRGTSVARETVSLRGKLSTSFFFFFFKQETV